VQPLGTFPAFYETRRSVRRLLITASVVPSSSIPVTLMEALSSSEKSVLTRATRRNVPEHAILHRIEESKRKIFENEGEIGHFLSIYSYNCDKRKDSSFRPGVPVTAVSYPVQHLDHGFGS
jgi:hypothetical protein